MANCDRRCKVYRLIEGLREKCLACRVCSDGNTMQGGGRGVVSIDAAEDPELVIARSVGRRHHVHAVCADEREERNVTALPPDVEDDLRRVASAFFGLRQVEVNLLWHLANGGSFATFADRMEAFSVEMGRYTHLDKRNAWAIFKRIGEAFGPFRALAGGLVGRGRGGNGNDNGRGRG